jgi:putative restriction endonuclease
MANEWLIIQTAFSALHDLIARQGRALTWQAITRGFEFEGKPLLFANRARGIFWPATMARGVLSVKTNIPRGSRTPRYDDLTRPNQGSFLYRFQGDDPENRDNIRLRESMDSQFPLIYFYGLAPGIYEPLFPVYVSTS